MIRLNKELFELKLKVILNQNLYQKNYIDEEMFYKVNEFLLKKIKSLV